MHWKNIVFVGTSHIAKQSLVEVKTTLHAEDPEIVAVELDKGRAYGLLHESKTHVSWKDMRKIGMKGYLFLRFGGWAEERLGKHVGVKPGEEMLLALRYAQREQKVVAFIDQDIRITLRNLSQRLTWKEKWRFFVDIVKSPFTSRSLPFDLRTVPDEKVIRKLIGEVKTRYPNVYRVLISDRNAVMAHRLWELSESFPEKRVVAIMGAGHVEDVISLLKKRTIKN